jgi:hypothetical protein
MQGNAAVKQMLIYDNVIPVSLDVHGAMSIKPIDNFEFARHTNSIPIVAQEFGSASLQYAIVFSESPDGHFPAVLVGIREDENVFVGKNGKWDANAYIPGFIRRYPFALGTNDSANTFTMMIDKDYQGLNKSGKGDRLFDDEGKQTTFTTNALSFLRDYQGHFQGTLLFGNKLAELGLLENTEAHLPLPGDPERRLGGFKVVNREKLRALPVETVARLNASGELEMIYCHLLSLNNLGKLQEKVAGKAAA